MKIYKKNITKYLEMSKVIFYDKKIIFINNVKKFVFLNNNIFLQENMFI